jgi:hypothetical protein
MMAKWFKDGIDLSKKLAGLGCALLLVCMIVAAWNIIPTATSAACRDHLKAELAAEPTSGDHEGKLRIAAVYPAKVSLGSQICIVVAGVSAKAGGAQANPPQPADIALFLNDERTRLSAKADAVPGPQLLIYPFGEHTDASTDTAKFWRGLLAGKTKAGTMELSVGISKTQSSAPMAVATSPIDFVVYNIWILAIGVAAMVVLIAAFVVFAANSTVLRDSATTDAAGKPNGTYSLGRTQMALWLGLSIAGFVFLWLTLGFYRNVITSSVLVLLGINGVTGLAAMLIKPAGKDSEPAKPADTAQPADLAKKTGFLEDLVCDGEGAKLQRIQMIVWTFILAIIFVWNVVWNFIFVEFDTNLLLLMGIASSTYLGFKTQEKEKT